MTFNYEMTLFQIESNKIEGINGTNEKEVQALIDLVHTEVITIQSLVNYVSVIQPDAQFREFYNVPNVQVGKHVAPMSGPYIREELQSILDCANYRSIKPFVAHCRYECLHPFTDGNGRSGRALWLWMRGGKAPLGFLHQFYYETLAQYEESF